MSRRFIIPIAVVVVAVIAWIALRPSDKTSSKTANNDQPDHKGTTQELGGQKLGNAAPVASSPSAFAGQWKKSWGSGPDEFGRDRPEEGNPQGPKSLAMGPNNTLYVLDQVNHRISLFDKQGKAVGQMPVPVIVPEDIAVGKDGTVAVLDRVRDKTVAILRPDGTLAGQLPLEGRGIPEGGGVTSIVVDGKDVWAEKETGQLIQLGSTSGTASEDRTTIPGRPSRDGHFFVSAGVSDPSTGLMYVAAINRPELDHRFTRNIKAPAPAPSILMLDTDVKGIIYMAVQVQYGEQTEDTIVQLLCMEPKQGAIIGSSTLPANVMPEESFKDFEVLDEGGVLYSYKTENGVEIRHYTCP
jgi:hypothetical protein